MCAALGARAGVRRAHDLEGARLRGGDAGGARHVAVALGSRHGHAERRLARAEAEVGEADGDALDRYAASALEDLPSVLPRGALKSAPGAAAPPTEGLGLPPLVAGGAALASSSNGASEQFV